MGRELWRLIEHHQATTPYGASVRGIAKAAGIGHSTLAKWKAMQELPTPEHLLAVARQINVPYRVALDAALTDAGYLPETRIKKHRTVRTQTRRPTSEGPGEQSRGDIPTDPQ